MIEGDRDFGYSLICDKCGEEETDFDTFYDAVDYKKEKDNDWKSIKTNSGWEDICPECNDTI